MNELLERLNRVSKVSSSTILMPKVSSSTILMPAREFMNRIIVCMPSANQEVSLAMLDEIIKITKERYCFLCFDPNLVEGGEIALELYPGCEWHEKRS